MRTGGYRQKLHDCGAMALLMANARGVAIEVEAVADERSAYWRRDDSFSVTDNEA